MYNTIEETRIFYVLVLFYMFKNLIVANFDVKNRRQLEFFSYNIALKARQNILDEAQFFQQQISQDL